MLLELNYRLNPLGHLRWGAKLPKIKFQQLWLQAPHDEFGVFFNRGKYALAQDGLGGGCKWTRHLDQIQEHYVQHPYVKD